MKVYVIMGNDFPAAVRLSEKSADAYVQARKDEAKAAGQDGYGRVYWRWYEFEVEGD